MQSKRWNNSTLKKRKGAGAACCAPTIMNNFPKRKIIRLPHYHYGQNGAYFITICAFQKKLMFGEIVNGAIVLNEWGRIVQQCWLAMPEHFSYVQLDQFVVMPNHFHAIIRISDSKINRVDSANYPIKKRMLAHSLPALVRSFKSAVTNKIHKLMISDPEMKHDASIPIWQRNYYEHVIRNETSFRLLQEYIACNPRKWELDELNPNKIS